MFGKIKDHIKEKIIGLGGAVSGVTSVLGSWQVCHNVCLGLIAILSLVGITVVGMPLLFLTRVAVPFWTAAFVLFLITLFFYFKMRCISKKLILFNSGVLIMGVPFQGFQFSPFNWIAGGVLVVIAIGLFVKDKIKK